MTSFVPRPSSDAITALCQVTDVDKQWGNCRTYPNGSYAHPYIGILAYMGYMNITLHVSTDNVYVALHTLQCGRGLL